MFPSFNVKRFTLRFFGLVATIIVGVLLMACTNQKEQSQFSMEDALQQQTGQNGRTCMRLSDIDGYNFDGRVITIDGGRRYYVGTTLMRCHEADMAVNMKFDGPGGDFCGSPNSTITTRDGRCTMKSLFEFGNRKAAFAAIETAKENIQQAQKEAAKTQ